MGLHRSTVEKLENPLLVERVVNAVTRNYSKKYIMEQYSVSRRQLERIVELNSTHPPYNRGNNNNN